MSDIDPSDFFEQADIDRFERLASQTHPDLIDGAEEELSRHYDYYLKKDLEQVINQGDNKVVSKKLYTFVGAAATGIFIADQSYGYAVVSGLATTYMYLRTRYTMLRAEQEAIPVCNRSEIVSQYLSRVRQYKLDLS